MWKYKTLEDLGEVPCTTINRLAISEAPARLTDWTTLGMQVLLTCTWEEKVDVAEIYLTRTERHPVVL